MKEIIAGNRRIGPNNEPFIIAEMSGNHNQSLHRALEIVEFAARSGAHALKLQTYKPDTITLDVRDREFIIRDPESLWNGHSLYELYEKAHTPWEWHAPIFKRARELGMLAFSTPFDETAVDLLESLDVPMYKIASFENIHLPLIRKAASTGKPLIISTGMASISEMSEAVEAARGAGCKDLMLLKCTSTYPADPSESNLLTIPHLAELFDVQVGLSDHTLGIGAAVAAVALGATAIEKHITLDREDGGVDSKFSLTGAELEQLVRETKVAWKAKGKVHYGPTTKEIRSKVLRRSLYIAEDVRKGDVLTEKNVKAVRPGLGLLPRELDRVLGKRVNRDVQKGTPVSWDLIG